MHAELFDELRDMGFDVRSGMLGENITTSGIDLLGLPVGARLHIGAEAIVEVTGLRNPCAQIDGIAPGLMDACLARDSNGKLIRKTGMFSIVVVGGVVRAGDAIKLEMPVGEQVRMQPV
jgi:MOSC domain-containing protein YiiM